MKIGVLPDTCRVNGTGRHSSDVSVSIGIHPWLNRGFQVEILPGNHSLLRWSQLITTPDHPIPRSAGPVGR